jgi:hypothetical protein
MSVFGKGKGKSKSEHRAAAIVSFEWVSGWRRDERNGNIRVGLVVLLVGVLSNASGMRGGSGRA